jgi:hypothetical protein
MQRSTLLACLATLCMATPACASDPVTDAMQAAYAPYREALFRTNGQAQAPAEQAMASTVRSWQSVIDRFAAKPPPPYDRDAGFAATLSQVAAVYARADDQVREKRLTEAHESLEKARELIAELRRRNGVISYSDHMNAYHAEMERLIAQSPDLLAAPQFSKQVMASVGSLEYLAGRLRSEAPAETAREAEFSALLRSLDDSLAGLRSAAFADDAAATRKAIGQLKPAYSKLFLRFG